MKIETPVLKRLGPIPFWRGQNRCLDELERIYRKAAVAVAAQAAHEEGGQTTRRGGSIMI